MTSNEKALQMHKEWNGKLETTAKAHVNSREDLAIAYTPGVAEPCKVIAQDPEAAYKYTMKANTVAVVSDGSAVLGLGTVAGNTRNMRASMLAITTQDYVKTARAKGLSPIRVVLKHQFKNSLVPIIPNLGVQIAGVLMGSFVVESMFLIPGLGRYFVDSVTNLDYPLIMGLTVFYGAFLVTMNLIVDVLYGLIDPRIRVK